MPHLADQEYRTRNIYLLWPYPLGHHCIAVDPHNEQEHKAGAHKDGAIKRLVETDIEADERKASTLKSFAGGF